MTSKARREHKRILGIIKSMQVDGMDAYHEFNEKSLAHVYGLRDATGNTLYRRMAWIGQDWNYRALRRIRDELEVFYDCSHE